eukprot:436295_1
MSFKSFFNKNPSHLWMTIWPIATAFIFGFIYLPIGIYNLRKYYKNRGHIVLIKRYSIITIYESILVCIRLLWGIIYVLFILWLFIYGVAEYDFVNSVLSTTDEFLTVTLSYLWCWRFYSLSYDIHFVVSQLNNEWKGIINPQFIQTKSSQWYINKRSTFGNPTWVKNHIGYAMIITNTLFACVPLFIVSIYYKQSERDDIFVWTALYVQIIELIPFILLGIIYLITPKFEDNFFIRDELRLLFIILSLDALCNTGLDTYVLLSNFPYGSYWYSIVLCIQFNMYWLTQFLAMLTSTYYVNLKVQDIINECRFSVLQLNARRLTQSFDLNNINTQSTTHKSTQIELYPMSSQHSMRSLSTDRSDTMPLVRVKAKKSHIKSASSISIQNVNLKQILTHPKAFDLFTWHLQYEFSIECILSFTEFVQFQELLFQYIQIHKDKDNDDEFDGRMWFDDVKLPSNVPKSFIVWYDSVTLKEKNYMNIDRKDFINIAQYKAYLLYVKYIDYGSELQINISHKIRSRLRQLFSNTDINGNWMYNDNISLKDLLILFDDICDQLYSLLNSAYDRFQQTTEFEKLRSLVFI